MSSKGFTCEVDLNLHLLSSLNNHECPSHFVYLTVELFGKVHKTRPQHAYYPLVFNETIQDEKMFWSPMYEDEVLQMLEDSPVVIELRRVDPCFYDGVLLAYHDTTAKDFIFSGYPKIPCSTNGREIYLERSSDFKGSIPRLRYSAFADLRRLGGNLEEDDIEAFDSPNIGIDDGYFSTSQSMKENKYRGTSSQYRSRRRSLSPLQNESKYSPYYTRQTVSSAIRSRSPSPNLNRNVDDFNEYSATKDSGLGSDKSKDPFVVKKVKDKLIMRNPKLHEPSPRETIRRRRSRRQQNLSTEKETTSVRRFRSASPTKRMEVDDKLESYRPSLLASNLGSWCHCYRGCSGHTYLPLYDYYADRLARLTRCTGCTSRYYPHCYC